MKKVKLTLTHSNGMQTIKEYNQTETSVRLLSAKITKVEGLENLIHLKHLDLSYNLLTKIEGLDTLVNLTSLYLHYNSITRIEGLDNLTKLTHLFLINNKITRIEGLDNLDNLTMFHAFGNPIVEENVIAEKWCYLDGLYFRIKSKKTKNDYIIIESFEGFWIVGKDGLYSHGKTLKEAKDDLIFKNLRKNFDATSLVVKIKEKAVVSVEDYRLITGACQRGVESFKKEIGLKADEMTLKDLKEKVKGWYGYERFMNLIENN